VGFRDGETVSQRTLDPLFYVQIVVPELIKEIIMLGSNAIYLAREIGSWNLINMDKAKQIDTLKKNEVTIRSFKNAISDMATMMYEFMSSDRRSNLYGYKIKFEAIGQISCELCSCLTNNSNIAFGSCEKDYNRIADDLEVMAKILDFEINNNMNTISGYDKTYKQMHHEVVV
jgi:hypothetical protein